MAHNSRVGFLEGGPILSNEEFIQLRKENPDLTSRELKELINKKWSNSKGKDFTVTATEKRMRDLGVQGYGKQLKTGRTFAEIKKLYPDLAAEYGEGRISELRQKVNEKLEFQRLKDKPEAYEKKLVKAKEWRDKQGEEYRIAQNERMSRSRGQAWKYPAPRSAKDALWKDLARSAKQNKRLSFVGGYPEGQLTSKQFKDLKFIDNANNKIITFNNLEKHISEHVKGKSYDDVIRPYGQKEFLRKEKLTQKLNEVLIKNFKHGSRQNVFHVQHVKGVATDPFDVHLTFGSQNVGEKTSRYKFNRDWKLAKNLTDKKKAVTNYYKSLGPDIQSALKNVPQGNKRTLVELLKKTGVDLPEEVITRATISFPEKLADIKVFRGERANAPGTMARYKPGTSEVEQIPYSDKLKGRFFTADKKVAAQFADDPSKIKS